MNRNEQSGEKKEGKDSGGRGELENRTGRVAWTICRGDFFFFFCGAPPSQPTLSKSAVP